MSKDKAVDKIMKIIYPISRWNNSSKARRTHIPKNENSNSFNPLCEYKKKIFTFDYFDGKLSDITCTECIKKFKESV
jgi:hypothetical protein